MYRSWWNVRQVCDSTTTLCHPGCLFPESLKAQVESIHLNLEVLAPLGHEPQQGGMWQLRWNYTFIPLGSLSGWDQMSHSYTSTVSHIYLGSGTAKKQTCNSTGEAWTKMAAKSMAAIKIWEQTEQPSNIISSSELCIFRTPTLLFSNIFTHQWDNEEWDWVIKKNVYPNVSLAVQIPCSFKGN